MRTEIIKRTFEAAQYPKGSEERKKLNEKVQTSEYFTSKKWVAIAYYRETVKTLAHEFKQTFINKKEAEEWLRS